MNASKRAPLVSALIILFCGCSTGISTDDLRSRGELSPLRAEEWKMENYQCAVKGNTANWQAAYCMWLNKTNDFEADGVEDCFETLTEHEGIPKKLCERNEYFKREICKTLVMDRIFHGSMTECLRSDDSVPRVVREGL